MERRDNNHENARPRFAFNQSPAADNGRRRHEEKETGNAESDNHGYGSRERGVIGIDAGGLVHARGDEAGGSAENKQYYDAHQGGQTAHDHIQDSEKLNVVSHISSIRKNISFGSVRVPDVGR